MGFSSDEICDRFFTVDEVTEFLETRDVEPNCAYSFIINDDLSISDVEFYLRNDFNDIKKLDVTGGMFDISIINTLKSLEKLSLPGNFITDISPLRGLKKLEFLKLEYNDVKSLSPLYGTKNLKSVTLTGNPIVDDKEYITKFKNDTGIRVINKR